MGKDILVVGSINMDLVMRVPRIPAPGQNVPGSDLETFPGGKGANQAVAAARLGCTAAMAGRVGADGFGDDHLASLVAAGVDTALVGRDRAAATGVALIMIDDHGENAIVISPGANGRFVAAEVAGLREAVAAAGMVLCQLELPWPEVAAVIRMARGLGRRVVLDPAPACAAPLPAFFDVDVLTPNRFEAEALLGRPIGGLEDAQRAAAELLARGPGAVVLKLGELGACLADARGVAHFPAFRVKVVDTTAAGDAFTAALAVALVEGRDLREAVRFGNAAGALAASKLGAQSSMPARAEVEALLAANA